MKAAVYHRYGPPEVVQIEDVEKPVPKDDEVRIEVHAASVNPVDWHFMRGMPYLLRIIAGLRKPKVSRLGGDVAGEVEAVGKNVTQFRPGEEVFGFCRGAFAEYVCAAHSLLVLKPENITHEQAASTPLAALTALQALRDKGRLQPGQKVLINGAAGGVGTFAVQIAKWLGAEVTGVCSTRNVDPVRSLGADHVIDYTRGDFTQSGELYDLLFDNAGNHSLTACRRVLKPAGILVMVGAADGGGRWMIGDLAGMIRALVLSKFGEQKMFPFLTRPNQEDLVILKELMKSGTVTPVIDRHYRLSEISEAIRYLESGHARGKVVITTE